MKDLIEEKKVALARKMLALVDDLRASGLGLPECLAQLTLKEKDLQTIRHMVAADDEKQRRNGRPK